MGLAGGMIWALDLDDFNNRCGEGRHPLLTAIKDVLSVPKGKYPGISDGSGDDATVGVGDSDDDDDDDEFAVVGSDEGEENRQKIAILVSTPSDFFLPCKNGNF